MARSHSIKMTPAAWVATWFGSGLSPKAPGTFGTLAGLPFAWLLEELGGPNLLLIGALLLLFIGAAVSEKFMEENGGMHDPGAIVVDEVMGIWLLMAALPHTWQGYVAGFIIFRIFDVLKPWPISYFDKHIKGGFGVMFDDLLAAIYPVLLWFLFTVLCWMTDNGHIIAEISYYIRGEYVS